MCSLFLVPRGIKSQPNPLSATQIPQIDCGNLATPKNPETEPSSLDTQENVSSLPTIHNLTHLTSTVNTNLYPVLFLSIPEGYEFGAMTNS